MIDLTGAALVAYLLRIVRDVVNRNPRFRKALGEVTFEKGTARNPSSLIQFGDVQVIIKSTSSAGNRLSFDYYMYTAIGRAVLAKVADKDGLFVEWIIEVDPGNTLLDPGVYYMNVNSVNEETREVKLTLQKFKWRQGSVTNAQGSLVFFRPGLNINDMVPTDTAAGSGTVQFALYPQYMALLSPVNLLTVTDSKTSQVLTPNVDFWVLRQQAQVVVQSTAGGQEIVSVPQVLNLQLQDQDGYVLRPNLDYTFYGGPNFVQLSAGTPIGSTISATGLFKVDPSPAYASVNPEDFLNVVLQPGEEIAPNEVFIRTSAGNSFNAIQTPTGQLIFPTLLLPGQSAFWELRIMEDQTEATALKMNLNKNLIPGLWVAIGDVVEVDDQVAVLVSPDFTETYEVYGSKEQINFVLEIKANDLTTSSELAEMIKHELLVQRRTNMSADGIEILEAPRTYRGEQRDRSGLNPTYSNELSVTALADWKEFIPVVTRVVSFEIDNVETGTDFPGKVKVAPRMAALGRFQFIPWQA